MIRAIGFDLGDTLLSYADTPLNWSSLYGDALAIVARACAASPTSAEVAAACGILLDYNTRVQPRSHEVAAEEIFSRVLRSWSLSPAAHVQIAVATFFTFFQQRMCAFPETLDVLRKLRPADMRLGVLTDVPYGMPLQFVQRDLDEAQISNLLDSVLPRGWSASVSLTRRVTTSWLLLSASQQMRCSTSATNPKMLSALSVLEFARFS